MRRAAATTGFALVLAACGDGSRSAPPPVDDVAYSPGAPGIGDPYFPQAGNGGYDVDRYDLDLTFDPATRTLTGSAGVTAKATANLSSFNFDLAGLVVSSVTVDGRPARFERAADELTVTPDNGLRDGAPFTAVVRYGGSLATPTPGSTPGLAKGFVPTRFGALIAGEPESASSWFPVNDHPSDRAAYRVRVSVPEGLTAVSNGRLLAQDSADGRSVWTWEAVEPMAPYLATLAVGRFELTEYRRGPIAYWDAVDTGLVRAFGPSRGNGFALGTGEDAAHRRIVRTIAVPAGGATLSFDVDRFVERGGDHVFVEARTPGRNDWTTLPDANGHTSSDVGFRCRDRLALHPFLRHYLAATSAGESECTAKGTTGTWHAATGNSEGYERWSVDLSGWAGRRVEVAVAHLDLANSAFPGVAVDDVVVSTGAGSTSFENGDRGGWRLETQTGLGGAAWSVRTGRQEPTAVATALRRGLARQDEIVDFLASRFGPYPFSTAGAIVHSAPVGFALETQTRSVYAGGGFTRQEDFERIVVHENAHQWFGDSLALERWQHIWLNEGFATYAEWLWFEHEGIATADESFAQTYAAYTERKLWNSKTGDPGPDALFESSYLRGAMTLHQIRKTIGDRRFFALLKEWPTRNAGKTVTTEAFRKLAEEIGGEDLSGLFTRWLFTERKPSPTR